MPDSTIICTAGHIDHGKTSLVKALTGIDCDSHPEEKKRGITINLGYAYMPVPNGNHIAFIDVPGHHAFINTMVGGASGVAYAILVIAADDGVMPQTIEHLRILELLGIKKGLIVISKIDLVDEEMLKLCVEDIKENIKNSFFHGCPFFKVSTKTKEGLTYLKDHLINQEYTKEKTHFKEIFRMYVDRAFIIKGFGPVVTGSILSGRINKGDSTYIYPGKIKSKVRQIQNHGETVPEIAKGERAALNLMDIDIQCLKPGTLISRNHINSTQAIDAEITLLDNINVRSLPARSKVIFLIGSYKTEACIYLLSSAKLQKGEKAFVQIYFSEHVTPCRGDRFIIRSTSADITLGGGIIIDVYPLKHVRKTTQLLSDLRALSSFADQDYILVKINQSKSPVSLNSVSEILQKEPADLVQLINLKLTNNIYAWGNIHSLQLFSNKHKSLISKDFLDLLLKIHELRSDGEISLQLISDYFEKKQLFINYSLINELLNEFLIQKKLIRTKNGYKYNDQLFLKADLEIARIENLFKSDHKSIYTITELSNQCICEKKLLNQCVTKLLERKKIYKIDDSFVSHVLVDTGREILARELQTTQKGITVAEFRDLLQCNRKIAILLFSILENEKLIFRKDDFRFLTNEAKKILLLQK